MTQMTVHEGSNPKIIQGGMGVGISSWQLAREVSRLGHLGVVSGTGLDTVIIRSLQRGDPEKHIRRAMEHFPIQEISCRILETYFRKESKSEPTHFKTRPMFTATLSRELQELLVLSNFVEVFLAKEAHGGLVGINYLEKIQIPTLPSLYGAMLAGVDYVLMGAGIPMEIPGVLDKLASHEEASYNLDVSGATKDDHFQTSFNPKVFSGGFSKSLKRPKFLAVIASAALAMALKKRASGTVDGFIVEAPVAGGHNAPPRGGNSLNELGEPIYGPRDEVDLSVLKNLGLPFWLAGGFGSSEGFERAIASGASGIQVGTAFALCSESGLSPHLKRSVLEKIARGNLKVFTDPFASPSGFPFKVAQVEGTCSEKGTYESRPRICDLGYLRQLFKKEDGGLGYRCPSEPVDAYIKKRGKKEDTVGRKCLCNALLANIGLAQLQKDNYLEKALVTLGDDINKLKRFFRPDSLSYSAKEVIQDILPNLKLQYYGTS